MINSRISLILPILVVLSLATISAQTLVAGQIYNSDYSSTLASASIVVTCNSNSLSTISLDDGTYAVRFEESECIENDTASVTVTKSGFNSKTESGVINKCDGGDCGGNYFTIINFALQTQTTNTNTGGGGGGGSSGGGFYLCGNGICDSGETVDTCPKDCNIIELTELNFKDDETKEETTTTQEQEETQQTAFSKITGAVVGTLKETKTWIVGIFILGVIGAFGVVRFRKRKEK